MDFPEDSPEAVNYLKQAIPITREHDLPPSPYYYAICYVYVTKQCIPLNKAFDEMLETGGGCSPADAKRLYNQFIADSNDYGSIEKCTKIADSLMNNISSIHSSGETLNDKLISATDEIKQNSKSMDKVHFQKLFIDTTQEICAINKQFFEKLTESKRQIEALKDKLSEMQNKVHHDDLTSLFNRAAFYRQLNQLISSPTIAKSVSLIIIDIDNFKEFNDNFGHLVGDRVLEQVGKLLLEHCKENAIPARYAGDEFIIIAYNLDLDGLVEFSERLRKSMQNLKLKIRGTDAPPQKITASFGISQYRPGETALSFIDRADKALYKSKADGRNSFNVL